MRRYAASTSASHVAHVAIGTADATIVHSAPETPVCVEGHDIDDGQSGETGSVDGER